MATETVKQNLNLTDIDRVFQLWMDERDKAFALADALQKSLSAGDNPNECRLAEIICDLLGHPESLMTARKILTA